MRGSQPPRPLGTFRIMTREPYVGQFEPVLPLTAIEPTEARPFDCSRTAPRRPSETKGLNHGLTAPAREIVCGPDGDCC